MNIIDTIRDAALFTPFFDLTSWRPWIAALKAIFGLAMDDAEVALFVKHTGRQTPPTVQSREGWLIVGRAEGSPGSRP